LACCSANPLTRIRRLRPFRKFDLPAFVHQPHHRQVSGDVIEMIRWAAADMVSEIATCPNCGNVASNRIILYVPWPHAPIRDEEVCLLRCVACGCGFVRPTAAADYAAEPAGADSSLAFYLQQGAGLWGIASSLSELDRPAGTRFLEVGCGFGFGLDFARRALAWDVVGLDPSPFAAAGRACLGLPIKSRYLVHNDPDLGDRFDVVMASEVIEHVPSPPTFVRTLYDALREGGSLVLTTPDIEAVGPNTPRGILVPLLSIGYHLVLQSAASLTALLQNADFVDVDVRQGGGGQLTVHCRRPPVTQCPGGLTQAGSASREQYRDYLREAAHAVSGGSDLWFGLTARAYREAVNAADCPTADALWSAFSAACQRRFGFEPDAAGVEETCDTTDGSMESLAKREPLCLGPVLLHRALHRLLGGEGRAVVEELFERAAHACARLRRSLQQIGSDDGDAEDVGWVAGAEALLCAAERGAGDVPERFHALGPSPADTGRELLRTDHFRRRLFVSLINAARLEEADRLADVVTAVEARSTVPGKFLGDDELDVLFCAAGRELQRREGGAERALVLLQQLRSACDAACAAGRARSAARLGALARSREIIALKVLAPKAEGQDLAASQTDRNCR
jgi:hypothetical protein